MNQIKLSETMVGRQVEPKIRFDTIQAIQSLAKELQLRYEEHMQDWAYEVADPKDVERYLQHYKVTTDKDKRFTLMKIIIEAINDQPDEASFLKYWDSIKKSLTDDFAIHEYTIFYWCLFNDDYVDIWPITPGMRDVWKDLHGTS